MTTLAEAEFFLASLLGHLAERNQRASEKRKVLLAKAGFYVHCIGHSFGGRFLAAAIQAAATPSEQTRKVLAAAHRKTPFA